MNSKTKAILGAALLVVTFLVGFLPQWGQKRNLRAELDAAQLQITALQNDLDMAKLRDLSGMMLLETMRQNYGSASAYSSQYFDKLRGMPSLASLLQSRDSVTSALAKGDPSSLSPIQALVERTYETTRHP